MSRKLVLAVIDAMKPAMLERAIATGRAPTLALLIERGHFVDDCVAAFPSVTPVCAASIATGEDVADLAVAAARAGCDLLWIPGDAADQDAARRALGTAIASGRLDRRRVAAALARVDALRARWNVTVEPVQAAAPTGARTPCVIRVSKTASARAVISVPPVWLFSPTATVTPDSGR